MARPRIGKRLAYPKPIMTYITADQRRALEAACALDGLKMSTFVRRLIAAALARPAARA